MITITQLYSLGIGLQFCVNNAGAFFRKETTETKSFLHGTIHPFSDFQDLTKYTTFVDKTLLISEFFNKSGSRQFHLITCPSKFGKTTNLDMMERFLRKSENNDEHRSNYQLFRNSTRKLKISRFLHEGNTVYKHFQAYEVIHISFKINQATTLENTLMGIRQILKSLFLTTYDNHLGEFHSDQPKYWSLLCGMRAGKLGWISEDDIAYGFRVLSTILNEVHGKKIFWLIDDYDYPILEAIQHNFDPIRVTQFIKKIFTELFSTPHTGINYALITGTVNVLERSEFPFIMDWNFLDDHPFEKFFGITSDELDQLFNHHSVNENVKNTVKQYYNAYTVANSPLRIYNLYSIINYLAKWNPHNPQNMLTNYWTEHNRILKFLRCSQTNPKYHKIIVNLLQLKQVKFTLKKRLNLEELDKLKNIAHNGTCDLTIRRIDLVLSYLFLNGYLSHGDKPNTYCLVNEEIKAYLNQTSINDDKSVVVDENELKSRLSPQS